MIGTIDIQIQAHNPNFPLDPVFTYKDSPQSFRIRNVPKKIGKWEITKVFVDVSYPDNSTASQECVLTGGVWVGTVEGCSTSGSCEKGFVVTACGYDEYGTSITGYVLGVGDVYVKNFDGSISPGSNASRMYFYETTPTEPNKGDVCFQSGVMVIWNGTEWEDSKCSSISDTNGNVINANRSVVVAVEPYWMVDDEYAMTGRKDYSTLSAENSLVTLVWSEDVFEGWKLAIFTRTSPSDPWTTLWTEIVEGSESDTQLTFPEHNVSVEWIANETRNDKLALTSEVERVNNPTIQLTQGGVLKGDFSLNQSNNQTINFDAVPTNTVTLSGTYTDQTTFSYNVYTT